MSKRAYWLVTLAVVGFAVLMVCLLFTWEAEDAKSWRPGLDPRPNLEEELRPEEPWPDPGEFFRDGD